MTKIFIHPVDTVNLVDITKVVHKALGRIDFALTSYTYDTRPDILPGEVRIMHEDVEYSVNPITKELVRDDFVSSVPAYWPS